MEGRCLMTTSSAWIASNGIPKWSQRSTLSSCSRFTWATCLTPTDVGDRYTYPPDSRLETQPQDHTEGMLKWCMVKEMFHDHPPPYPQGPVLPVPLSTTPSLPSRPCPSHPHHLLTVKALSFPSPTPFLPSRPCPSHPPVPHSLLTVKALSFPSHRPPPPPYRQGLVLPIPPVPHPLLTVKAVSFPSPRPPPPPYPQGPVFPAPTTPSLPSRPCPSCSHHPLLTLKAPSSLPLPTPSLPWMPCPCRPHQVVWHSPQSEHK